MQKNIIRCQLDIVSALYQPHDIVMARHDALRRARGPRRVRDIGSVLRMERDNRGGRGLLRDGGPVGVEADDARSSMCTSSLRMSSLRRQRGKSRAAPHG